MGHIHNGKSHKIVLKLKDPYYLVMSKFAVLSTVYVFVAMLL